MFDALCVGESCSNKISGRKENAVYLAVRTKLLLKVLWCILTMPACLLMAAAGATPPPGEEGGSKFNSWGRATSAAASEEDPSLKQTNRSDVTEEAPRFLT